MKFPVGSGIPRKFWKNTKMSPKFILSRLYKWCEEAGVEIIFCKDEEEAAQEAMRLMTEAVELINVENTEN